MSLPHRLAAVPQRGHGAPARPAGPAPARAEVAPALFRLLAESALARAALDACGQPLALVEALGEPEAGARDARQRLAPAQEIGRRDSGAVACGIGASHAGDARRTI